MSACQRAAPAAAPATPVNIQDSAQVRAVVRDYLIHDPTVLKDALDALAERQQQARRVEIQHDARDASFGPADAPITLVEFFDYRCPYCHAAMSWVFDTMATRRDIRVVFKEFPILGPESREASRAAIASMKQGRYREFHQALMAWRGELPSAQIDAIARQVGIDVPRMRRDMNDPAIDQLLDKTHGLAVDSNITGTPTFMINGEMVASGFNRAALEQRLADATRETASR